MEQNFPGESSWKKRRIYDQEGGRRIILVRIAEKEVARM